MKQADKLYRYAFQSINQSINQSISGRKLIGNLYVWPID